MAVEHLCAIGEDDPMCKLWRFDFRTCIVCSRMDGRSGTRVDDPYINETPCQSMPNQEESMSCSAACAKKLLCDSNVDKPESEIRALAQYHPICGIDPFDLADALSKLHPTLKFAGGCVIP